ncbi:MAG TPA: ester cyclase [Polyangia bacterium]|nr:ester cyclase [Polyangia bacterium]
MKNALTALALILLFAAPATAKKPTAKEFMEKYFAAVDSKNPDRLAEVDAADVEFMTPMGTFKGLEGHKQLTAGFANAMPNFKHTVTKCIEQGDTYACEGNFTGDHTGPMMMPNGQTVPATGKHVEFKWGGMATVKNGKVATIHAYFDIMTMMQQLGLVPPAVAKK